MQEGTPATDPPGCQRLHKRIDSISVDLEDAGIADIQQKVREWLGGAADRWGCDSPGGPF